jgi:hypothetical protein
LAFGGGIGTGPPGFPFVLIVEDNVFTKNEVYGIYSAGGGGLADYSPGRVITNKFYNNYVYCETGVAAGGGMSANTMKDPAAQLILVSGNIVSHNKTECTPSDTIGAISAGIQIWGFNISVTNNTITHNEVICPTDFSYGAGVVLDYPNDNTILKNNIISNNKFSGGGGCIGGGVVVWDGDAKLFNNVISHNQSTYGGGIWVGNEETISAPLFINNTIVKNEATIAGGGIYYNQSEVTLMNSIMWENYAPADPQIGNYIGSIDVSYSDVQGGWTGTGNMDVNPKLISNLCLLNHRSPCIDAGNPDMMFYDPEDPFQTGYALYPAQGLVRNDMGAYGGPGAVDWYELLESENFQVEQQVIQTSSRYEIKIDNYPNPFNPQTTIQLVLPQDGFVSLKIYNVLGQEVATLVSDNLTAGSYKYVWNASNFASGIYVYRIEANGLVMDKKMILMK